LLHATLEAAHTVGFRFPECPLIVPAIVLDSVAGNRRSRPVLTSPAMNKGGNPTISDQLEDGLDLVVRWRRKLPERDVNVLDPEFLQLFFFELSGWPGFPQINHTFDSERPQFLQSSGRRLGSPE